MSVPEALSHTRTHLLLSARAGRAPTVISTAPFSRWEHSGPEKRSLSKLPAGKGQSCGPTPPPLPERMARCWQGANSRACTNSQAAPRPTDAKASALSRVRPSAHGSPCKECWAFQQSPSLNFSLEACHRGFSERQAEVMWDSCQLACWVGPV